VAAVLRPDHWTVELQLQQQQQQRHHRQVLSIQISMVQAPTIFAVCI
jgi:hypothetical protein